MNGPEWVTVAVIVAAHGVRGEVRVKPLTDFPDRLCSTKILYAERPDVGSVSTYSVESARSHGKGMYVLKLSGVDDRDAAEALRSTELKVSRADVVPLPEGSYYVFELIGFRVETSAGEWVGELVDVLTTGANDVYQVRGDGGKEVLVPAIRDVVKQIDTKGKVIVIDPPAGLL